MVGPGAAATAVEETLARVGINLMGKKQTTRTTYILLFNNRIDDANSDGNSWVSSIFGTWIVRMLKAP